MHEETVRDLIDNGFAILGSLAKDHIIHQREMEIRELQREKELERARILAGEDRSESTGQTDTATARTGPSYPDRSSLPEGKSISPNVPGEKPTKPAAATTHRPSRGELLEEIQRRREATMCETCLLVLDGLEEMDARAIQKGLREYDDMKARIDRGLDGDELREHVKQYDIVPLAAAQ